MSDPERLVRDVHPADLLLPDGSLLRDVRVFVTTRRLLAYQATADRKIERAASFDVDQPVSVPASRNTLPVNGRLEVRLADGATAWVNRGHGCGCHSPLRAMSGPVSWTGQ